MAFKYKKSLFSLISVVVLSGFFLTNPETVKANDDLFNQPTAATVVADETNTSNFYNDYSIDPLFEGSNVITGTTNFDGTVYAFVNGVIATKAAEIVDNKFTLEFLPTQSERFYLPDDIVTLSFISKNDDYFFTTIDVTPLKPIKEPVKFEPLSLYSDTTVFTGTAPANHQILLYNYDTKEFIGEVMADDNGNYEFNLPNLSTGDRILTLHVDVNSQYRDIVIDTVDSDNYEVVEPKDYLSILKELGLVNQEYWSGDDNFSIGVGLDTETTLIFGYTNYTGNIGVFISSSNPDKKYPLIPVNRLGYWGINLEENHLSLEKDEELTFKLVNLSTNEEYFELSDTVSLPNEFTELHEYPFEIDTLNPGDKAIHGKVAPNLNVKVTLGSDKNVLAELKSDENGLFTIELDTPLTEKDILYFSAFDDSNTPIAWKAFSFYQEDEIEDSEPNVTVEKTEENTKPSSDTVVEDTDKPSNENTSDKENTPSADNPVENKDTDNPVEDKKDKEQMTASIFVEASNTVSDNSLTTQDNDKDNKPANQKMLPKTNESPSALSLLLGLGLLLIAPVKRFKKKYSI